MVSTYEERDFAIVLYPGDPYSCVMSVVRALPTEIVYKLVEGAISRIFMIVKQCPPYICVSVRPPLERTFKRVRIPALLPATFEDLVKHAISEISTDGSPDVRYVEVPRKHIMRRIQQLCEEYIVPRFRTECGDIAKTVTDMVLPPSHP